MAQYKVPQDVEAEDKLLGPFTFRQFIYLIVTAGCIALAYTLFQVFPLLALIPLPVIIFFGALALPLKKDQPMETYLAAIVSFYLKPRKRFWIPGEAESTIEITAPKQIEKPRARNISEEEAGHRLSFLADLIDTEGKSIRNVDSAVKEEYIAEANAIPDILDSASNANINQIINREEAERREKNINQLRAAMNRNSNLQQNINPIHEATITPTSTPTPTLPNVQPINPTQPFNQSPQPQYSNQQPSQPAPSPQSFNQPTVPLPFQSPSPQSSEFQQTPPPQPQPQTPNPIPQTKIITDNPVVFQPNLNQKPTPRPSASKQAALKNLANNQDYSIETLAKEAKRLENQDDKEVYISLH